MSRILVIEDQSDIRRLIRWALEDENHEMFEATDGHQGLAAARAVDPHLILLDVTMPGELNGFQVCEQLRADPGLRHKPVVMLTGRARERDRDAADRAGADAFIPKPFSRAELLATIDRLVVGAAPVQAATTAASPG